MRETVRNFDSGLAVTNLRTMSQVVEVSLAPRRFNTLLLGFFALAALALAAVGIYAVLAYSVTQPTHEIGIRMAVGARGSNVLGMVLGDSLKLAMVGIAIGTAGSPALEDP